MRRFAEVFALALALASVLPVGAADPYAGYVYPAALSVGTTNRVLIGGQNLWGNLRGWISGDGIKVLEVEKVPNFPYPDSKQRNYLKDWLTAIAHGTNSVPELPVLKPSDAWRTNVWWTKLNELDEKSLAIVAKDLWVRRNPLQSAPSLRQLALVTVAVSEGATPGLRQLRLYRPDGISAPRPIAITSVPVVEEPLYVPPTYPAAPKQAVTNLPVAVSGQVLPGETDKFDFQLAPGKEVTAKVTARSLQPYIGDAVPGFFNAVLRVVDSAGREIAFADDSRGFDPDPAVVFAVPDDGRFTVEISDRLFRGREDFVYTIDIAPSSGKPASAASLPQASAPGRHDFHVDSPGKMVFDLRARRIGSAIDAVMTLVDSSGKRLACWDDSTNAVHVGAMIQDELDPTAEYEFTEPGDFAIIVRDSCGRSGAEFGYDLAIRRPDPRFVMFAERSGFILANGQRVPFNIHIRRSEGFVGPITLVETENVRFDPPIIPAGTNEWKVSVIGKRNMKDMPPVEFDLIAVGESADGRILTTRVLACDAFDQAFAWRHHVSFGRFVYKCNYVKPKGKKKP